MVYVVFTNFPECHYRLNTELLNLCNIVADFSFFLPRAKNKLASMLPIVSGINFWLLFHQPHTTAFSPILTHLVL